MKRLIMIMLIGLVLCGCNETKITLEPERKPDAEDLVNDWYAMYDDRL